jgi:hypothetical protein
MYSLYIVYYDMGTPCCPPHGAGQQCAQPYMPDRLRKITWFEPIVRPSTWTGDMAYGLHIRPLTCYTMGTALSGETVDSSDTSFQSSSSTPKINQFLKAIQHPPPPPPRASRSTPSTRPTSVSSPRKFPWPPTSPDTVSSTASYQLRRGGGE